MMTPPKNITLYGAHWCPDCRRSKTFLGEHQIPYNWVDIEQDKEGEAYVIQKNEGKRIIPTIEFDDGSILVEPSNAELAAKLGLKTTATKKHYDLIVIGGGPAGLTAALYTAREGIDTLVIERAALGGQAAGTERLDNVPGFADGIAGAEFGDQLRRQAARFGVEMLQAQDVIGIEKTKNYALVTTADGSKYSAQSLLIASGSRYRRLDIEGEDNYIGAGIHFCATCDGPFYKGQEVVVIGGGNSATEESLFLVKFVEKVTILVRGDELTASQVLVEKVMNHPKVQVRFNTAAVEFRGTGGKLNTAKIKNNQNGEFEELNPAGVFIFIGQTPNSAFLADSGIYLDQWGFIITGHILIHGDFPPVAGYGKMGICEPGVLETSLAGVFAAGDVRAGSTKQVAAAAGEGATAALLVREYLKTV
jgi:thioredoxin reductase (NADPH)